MFKSNFSPKVSFFFLVLLSLFICSEKNLAQKNPGDIVAIELTKMNILYLGIDNPIKVAVSGCRISDVKVNAVNAEIRNTQGNLYVQPKNVGTVTISVYCKDKLHRNAQFRVKRVPDPIAKIGSVRGGNISKSALMAQRFLNADLANFDFDYSYKIIQFTMSITTDGFAREFVSNSNKFTKEQISAFQKIKRGQKIYFENIKAKGPDGTIRVLSNLIIKVR